MSKSDAVFGRSTEKASGDFESRRSFMKKASAATITIAAADLILPENTESENGQSNNEVLPWYRRITRWGQTNITETDPATYDIKWWRNYWKRTLIGGIIVNAGGIVAYYPSKVPLHRQAEYLGGRDLFGELCRSAHEDGLAVFARMDSNRAHEEFYKAHPDWFAIDKSGKPFKAGDLFITCINSPYYNDHIPSIIKEIIELYHPEGFTDNSWSGLGRDSICYCDNCRKNFRNKHGMEIPPGANWDDQSYRQWIHWNYNRRLEIWDLNNRISKSTGGKECIWAGMNSGSVSSQCRSFRDYKEICARAEIIMLDSQARNDAEGFQQNGISGKIIHSLLGWEKLIPESMAMYQAGRPTFRLSSKPVNEARMWMTEGIAGGIQPWWHHVGAYHEDRRMYKTAAPVMTWHKTNEEYLINRHPISNVGVVWSQQNMDFYGRDATEQLVELPWLGITQALIRSRIPFLPVHADHIERDAKKFSLLILPNLGVMTDDQVALVRRYVAGGGNLMATGESSLYNEWGDPRADYALSDIFGAHITGKVPALSEDKNARRIQETLHTYLRILPEIRSRIDGPHNSSEPPAIGERHSVFKGFEETDILPFGGSLNPLKTDKGTEIMMTFIPAFPIYPPETSWMRIPKTNIPGLILNKLSQGSRVVFLPADIDRQFGRYNLPDHGNLLANIIRWTSNDDFPLLVDGPGLIDCHVYRQEERLVIHFVNLTNAGTWRQPVDELIPVGPLSISIRIPEGIAGNDINLLVSGKKLKAIINEGWSRFEINTVLDHEVAVIL
ncbi:MAG: beta-galactosidase [Bacteroidia bacterium]|nr:beta-galactosidase [Bacteroidia bacterium]